MLGHQSCPGCFISGASHLEHCPEALHNKYRQEMSKHKPEVPEDRCWYCDQDGTDHKHGSGRSCGDCCATHGSMCSEETMDEYRWVEECLKAKNERIARLEAENRRLKAPVSEEECRKFERHYGEKLMLNYVEWGLTEFLAARAAQTGQEGK